MMKMMKRLALAVACTLTSLTAFGQAVYLNFNTPGQLTNNFGFRSSAQAANAAVWYEVPTNGVGGGGSVDAIRVATDYETLTYIGNGGFFWPTNGSGNYTQNVSLMIKGRPGPYTANQFVAQLGLISTTNGTMEGSANLYNGNHAAVALYTSANGTNFYLQGNAYVSGPGLNPAGNGTTNAWLTTTNAFTNWYKLSATFVRSFTNVSITSQLDDLGFDGNSAPTTRLILSTNLGNILYGSNQTATTVFYPCFRLVEAAGIDLVDNFSANMTNGPAVIVVPPVTQTVMTNRSAKFVAKVDGTPPFSFTWYTNNVVVPGATGSTLSFPVASDNMITSVYVAVTNALGGASSIAAPAALVLTADGDLPIVLSAGSVDGNSIAIAFNELLDPVTALNPANYTVTATPAVSVTGASLQSTGQVVRLTLSSQISGSFSVSVENVKDLGGNLIGSPNSTNSTVLGLTSMDLGLPQTAGYSYSTNLGDIDVSAGGQDIANYADSGHFNLAWRTNDFDVKVRIQSISRIRGMSAAGNSRDEFASAAIMARENTYLSARDVYARVFPADFGMPVGGNRIQWLQRTVAGTTTANMNPPNADLTAPAGVGSLVGGMPEPGGWFPNLWLRMRRVNNTFSIYYCTNAYGTNWILQAQTTQPYPSNMLVGLATCAHVDDPNTPVTVQYRSFGEYVQPVATLAFSTNLPSQVTIAATTYPWSGTATLTAAALVTGVTNSEVQFVWQRGNGIGGFTNISTAGSVAAAFPNPTNTVASYTTPAFTPADSGAQYRVIATVPGSQSVTSAVCMVTVGASDGNRIGLNTAGVTYLAGYNTITLSFTNEPIDFTSAAVAGNYVITNNLGQAVTVTNVIVIQPSLLGGFGSSNYTRVILQTSSALTNNTGYYVVVNNVKGTNGFALTANSTRPFINQSTNVIKVEMWAALSNGTPVAILTNSYKFVSNGAADYVWYTNTFGFNWGSATLANSWMGDTNGGRITAYFVPPSNAVYRFYIRNDNEGQLWMNTNGPDRAGKTLIAWQTNAVPIYTNLLCDPSLGTNSMTTNFTLLAGIPYYMEALWKEDTGADGFAMTWTSFPDMATANSSSPAIPPVTQVADGSFFYPFMQPVTPVATGVTNAPVRIECFANVGSGQAVDANCTSAAKVLARTPDLVLFTNMFGFNTNLTGSFFASNAFFRVSAYFVAPSNGFYRFYTKSDDGSQLWMNTNGINPAGKQLISYYTVNTGNAYLTNGTLVPPGPISLTNGQWYYIEALIRDLTGGNGFAMAFQATTNGNPGYNNYILTNPPPAAGAIADGSFFRYAPAPATPMTPINSPIQAELYTGIGVGNTAQADLTNNMKFLAGMPDNVMYPNQFGWQRDAYGGTFPGDNYGARISSYFVAPSNAYYRFFLRADDTATLFFNTNGTDAAGKQIIASVGSASAAYAAGNASGTNLFLTAGKAYYMEALLKEGTGGDYLTVAFRATNGGNGVLPNLLPANTENLSSDFFLPIMGVPAFTGIANIVSGTAGAIGVTEGQTLNFYPTNLTGAMPLCFQWKKNGTNIIGANGMNYTTPSLTFADSGAVISLMVYNSMGAAERALAIPPVGADLVPLQITNAVGNGTLTEVTVTFTKNVLPATATNLANYAVPGLTITGAWLKTNNVVALQTSLQIPGTRYTVFVNGVTDTARNANVVLNASYTFTAWNWQRGLVTLDFFSNISPVAPIQTLWMEPKFINNAPDSTTYNASFFGYTGASVVNYGARAYGWFIAPSNGVYRFYISADDQSALYMNTNAANSTDPAGKVLIAMGNKNCCGAYGNVDLMGPVISPNITLTGGQMYYLEGQWKQATGGDYFRVAMRTFPNMTAALSDNTPPAGGNVNGAGDYIPAYFFASLGNPDLTTTFSITNQPASVTTGAGSLVSLTVGALAYPAQTFSYQWQQWDSGSAQFRDINLTNIFLTTLSTNNLLFVATAGTTNQYRALVWVPGLVRTSAVATVSVPTVTSSTTPSLVGAFVSATNRTSLRAFFNQPVTPDSAQNTANYVLTDNTNNTYTVYLATLLSDNMTVILSIDALTPGNYTNYTLTANNITDAVSAETVSGLAYTFYVPDGTIRANYYNIASVWPYATWPSYPVSSNFVVTNSFNFGTGNLNGGGDAANPYITNNLDNYSATVYGYLIPPSNGVYRFWISSDDNSELRMNTNSVNSDSPTNTVYIAGASGYNAFTAQTSSVPISLRAGQRYYMEARYRDGSGGDAVSVAMRELRDLSPLTGPTRGNVNAYASNQLSTAFLSSPGLAIPTMGTMTFDETATNVTLTPTVLGLVGGAQWYTNDVNSGIYQPIPNATNLTYKLSLYPSNYTGIEFALVVTNFGYSASNAAVLTTTATLLPDIYSVRILDPGTILVTFNKQVSTNTATNFLYYVISDGVTVTNARYWPDGSNVVLFTTGLTPGSSYTVANTNIYDRVLPDATTNLNGTAYTAPGQVLSMGFLAVDYFAGPAAMATLLADARYLDHRADWRTTIASTDWRSIPFPGTGWANYGTKNYGWFFPPVTTNYIFYLRADDNVQIFMNTNGPSPGGKVAITPIVAFGAAANYSTNVLAVTLTAGQPYYFEVDFTQGTGQEYWQMTFTTNGAPLPTWPGGFAGTQPTAYYPGLEVAAGAYFGVYGDASGTLTVVQQPVGTNIAVGQSATMVAAATATGTTPYLFYQWQFQNYADSLWYNAGPTNNYQSDFAMLGNRATNNTGPLYYTTPYRVVYTLAGGVTAISSVATITVPDGLNCLGVASVDATNLVITFDKPVDPVSAATLANYAITNSDGSQVLSGTPVVLSDGRRVALTVTSRLTPKFIVAISGVNDVRLGYNVTGIYSGTSFNLDFLGDVGNGIDPTNRGSILGNGNGADVVAGGSDIFGTADGMFYAGKWITGNFDIRVRVASITNILNGLPNTWSKAGLIVRPSTNNNSRNVAFVTAGPAIAGLGNSGQNMWSMTARDTNGAASLTILSAGSPAWPGYGLSPWLRMVRLGSGIYVYRSLDGTNWVMHGYRDTAAYGGAYPDTVLVGLGTTSHANGTNVAYNMVTAQYRDLYLAQPASILTQPAPTGYTNIVGSSVTFSGLVVSNPPGYGSLVYQWRKNGVDIEGAISGTLALNNLGTADSGAYSVMVANDGGGQISSNLYVSITNGLLVIQPETNIVVTPGSLTTFSNNVLLLGNDASSSGKPLSIVGVSGSLPTNWFSDFNNLNPAALPNGMAVYGNAYVTNSDGFTNSGCLVLTTNKLSQTGSMVITNDLTPGRAVSGFTATFKLRIDGGGADGMSFNLASDLPLGTTAFPEEGAGTGLSVCIDNFDNGTNEAPAIEIRWKQQLVARAMIAKINDVNYKDVTINLRSDSTMDVYYAGVAVLSNVATPYVPIANGRFGLYARTGGQFENHYVDNLSITVYTLQTTLGGTSTVFTNSFDAGMPAGATLYGNYAYVTNQDGNSGGCLKLTFGTNNQWGAFILDELTPGRAVSSFTANFKVRMAPPISAEPADGWSFNFGPNLPTGAKLGQPATGVNEGTAVESGVGMGLSVGFRDYRFTGVANTAGFVVKYGGTIIATQQVAAVWNNTAFKSVAVTLNTDGTLTLNVDGTNVFNNLQTGYQPIRGQFGWYARSGGSYIAQWFDEIGITVPDGSSVTLNNGIVNYVAPRSSCGFDTIYYLVSDNQGNTAVDSVSIFIANPNPTVPYVVSCASPTNLYLVNPITRTIAIPDYTVMGINGLIITDQCNGLVLTQSPPAGTLVGEGTTNVIISAWNCMNLSNGCSATVNVLNTNSPTIIGVSSDTTVVWGQTLGLGVFAKGFGPLYYFWRQDTNTLRQAGTLNSLSVPNATCSDAGYYDVVVSNVWGMRTSAVAKVTINDTRLASFVTDLVITNPVMLGTNYTMTVDMAANCNPPTYGWFFNSNAIPWAAGNSLTLTNVQLTDAGQYYVLVTNQNGITNSLTVTLVVTNPASGPANLVITPSPTNTVYVGNGNKAEFSVTADGVQPITFYWYKLPSLTALVGEGNSFTSAVVTCASEGDAYHVVASNTVGMATSAVVYVEVRDTNAPAFNPAVVATNVTLLQGTNFSVTVGLAANCNLATYRWYANATNLLASQTTPTLSLANLKLNDGGIYTLIVSNQHGLSAIGTAAVVAVSYLIESPMVIVAGETFQTTVVAEPNRAYWLEARNSLTEGTWTFVLGVTNVTGPQVLQDAAAAGPYKFYRIGSAPAP